MYPVVYASQLRANWFSLPPSHSSSWHLDEKQQQKTEARWNLNILGSDSIVKKKEWKWKRKFWYIIVEKIELFKENKSYRKKWYHG